jgi:hypothetical protein
MATVVPTRDARRRPQNITLAVEHRGRRAESRAKKFFQLAGFCCAAFEVVE